MAWVRRMTRRIATGLLAVLLAGCVAAPKPAVPPPRPPVVVAPPPAPVLPPPPAQPWDELPVTEGGWQLAADGRTARFVDDGGVERAAIACAVPGRIVRIGLNAERTMRLGILTSSELRDLMLADGSADVPVGDPILDAIAFSRGRFALRASQLLVLPVQAEIGRVIEDCRG